MSENKQLNQEDLEQVSGGESAYYPTFTFVLTFKFPMVDHQETREFKVTSLNEQTARSKAISEAMQFCKDYGFTYVSLKLKTSEGE